MKENLKMDYLMAKEKLILEAGKNLEDNLKMGKLVELEFFYKLIIKKIN